MFWRYNLRLRWFGHLFKDAEGGTTRQEIKGKSKVEI